MSGPYGKLLDEPIETYHANPAISKTKLDTFRRSPRLYWKLHVAKCLPKPEKSEALIIGSAVDALALEGPQAYAASFIVAPKDAPKRPTRRQEQAKKPSPETIEALGFWREFDAAAEGKTVLDSDQADVVRRCADALHANPAFSRAKAAARTQASFRVQGQHFDVQVRPDLWLEEGCDDTRGEPAIYDLKTTWELPQDDPDHLSRHIATFGYHRGAYLYPEIVAQVMRWKDELFRPKFVLAFVEKDEPHAVVIREVDDIARDIGARETTDALMRLRRCVETSLWPDTWDAPMKPIGLPAYYIRRALETTAPNPWG